MGNEEEGTRHRRSCKGKDLNKITNDPIGLDSFTSHSKVSLATFGLDGLDSIQPAHSRRAFSKRNPIPLELESVLFETVMRQTQICYPVHRLL